jgi:hypothetical protein
MSNKLILEELFRMREIMGISLSETIKNKINSVLLLESGKIVDEFMPIGAKSVDNLTKQGVDFANDLSKLSDEFTNQGIKTFDDLTAAVAAKNPTIDPKNITDDMIKSYIKNDDKLYKSILAKAASAAAAEADILVKNADVTALFRADPAQLANAQRLLGASPNVRTIDTLIQGVDDSIVSIEKTIDDINVGNVPGVRTVPKDLDELYEQLLAKKLDLENYKNKDVAPTNVVDDTYEKFMAGIPKIADDTGNVVDPRTYLSNILNKLESQGLINFGKLDKSVILDELMSTVTKIEANANKAMAVFEKLSPSDQARFAQDAIQKLKSVTTSMKSGASSGGGPSWFKRFFFNAVDQVDEFGVKNSKLKPIKIVGGILKLYVTVGLISALVCTIKEVYQDKKSEWDDFNFGDYGDCAALSLTWGPEIFTNLVYNPYVDITTKDYENTPEDFAKWVKSKNFSDADYSDADGFTYKDADGDRQPAAYDSTNKTFK